MPESGAIQRTRDAMDAWLRMDLPADFDQLRADLRHILACIPDTHQRPAPPVIGEGVHFRTRGGTCEAAIVVDVNGPSTVTAICWTPAPDGTFRPLTVTAAYYGGHAGDNGPEYMPITWHRKDHPC